MAITKAKTTLVAYADGNTVAGLTKAAAAAATPWTNVSGAAAIEISWRLKNGSSAPGVAPTLLLQTSPDNGTTVYDGTALGGDTVANSDNSNSFPVDAPQMYVRVLAFGHSTNPVGVGIDLLTIAG